jgi:hypothetical protein
LLTVALCAGGAVVLAPAKASVDENGGTGAGVDAGPADTGPADRGPEEMNPDDTAEVSWRITEHPAADLPTDPESLAAREIYPGVTLGELDYSAQDTEWALYQAPFGTAASAIETEFADAFAFAYFGPERSFTIGFAADAPAGAIALLDGTGLPYSTFEDVGFTDAELQTAVSVLVDDVSDLLDDADVLLDDSGAGAGFSIGADSTVSPGLIKVEITGDDSDIRRAGMAAVAEVSTEAPFSVTVVEGGEGIATF